VLFKFPDRASVKAFYENPEYQDLLALRHRVAETRIVVVDGLRRIFEVIRIGIKNAATDTDDPWITSHT